MCVKHITLFNLQCFCEACSSVHPIVQMNKLKMGQFKVFNQSHIVIESQNRFYIYVYLILFYHVILILVKIKEKFLSHSELIFLCLYSWGLVSGLLRGLSSDLPTTVSISCFLSCSGVGTHWLINKTCFVLKDPSLHSHFRGNEDPLLAQDISPCLLLVETSGKRPLSNKVSRHQTCHSYFV